MLRNVVITVAVLVFTYPLCAETPPNDWAEKFSGDAVFGVDHLGRVLIAIDLKPTDGLVDRCLLFTAAERLSGPWERRSENVQVLVKGDSVSLRETPPFFALSLAVEDGRAQDFEVPPTAEVFSSHGGVELVSVETDAPSVSLEAMDVFELATWPEIFWYDFHDPGSVVNSCDGSDPDCVAGGPGSTQCGISCNTEGANAGCEVSCGSGQFKYACCACEPIVFCRCRPC